MSRHQVGRTALFGIVVVAFGCSRDAPAGGWDGVETVITNVAVVSVETGTVELKRAIAVRDGRIDWIGSALDVPTDIPAAVIDGSNAYVIPGLIDLHVHTEERDFPLYLTAGVTTVLFKHGDTTTLTWRERARRGELLAPRIYTTGPLIAGREIHWPHVVATSAAEADARVREQLAAGYDFIKVYDFLSLAAYRGLAAAATEIGIRFIGHTPDGVGLASVLDAGQHCIDHADQLIYSTHGRQASMEVTAEEATAIAEAFAGHDTCFTSTLFGMKALMARGTSWSDSLYARPEMAFVDQGIRDWWNTFRSGPPSEERLAQRRHFYDAQVALTRALYDVGVTIVAGTDTPNLLLVPGFSIHDELQVLVEDVGLDPASALRTVTISAAEMLGVPGELGKVSEGYVADLVLAGNNPLEGLATLRRPVGVMLSGQWFDSAALGGLIDTVRAH